MPSCKLTVVYDRPERTYLPGEEVSGYVEVRADADVNCKDLTVEHRWQTHGKGNTARGPSTKHSLFSGTWRAGDFQRYAFRFTTPEGPFTYRGTYLNVDHYVLARADVPWAVDPKAEEEFILLPGPTGSVQPSLLKDIDPKQRGKAKTGVLVGVGMIALGLILFFPCFPLAIVGGIVLYFALRKQMAESRLGEVQFDLGPQIVSPGATLPITLSFTASKNTPINQVYVELTCNEVCVSGSGTNKSTHKHNVHTQRVQLSGEMTAAAGQRVRLETSLTIPETGAYSFDAADNDLQWNVELRIDIPRWPDWLEQRKLVVVPRGHAAAPAGWMAPAPVASPFAPSESVHTAEVVDERPAEAAPTPFEFAGAEPRSAAEPAGASIESQPAKGALSLAEALTRITEADRFNGERQTVIDACLGLRFSGELVVDRVSRNFSYDDDPRFREGRIVLGKPAGTDLTVTVRTPKSQNEELDALVGGDLWPLDCTLAKWDDLFNRAELRVVV